MLNITDIGYLGPTMDVHQTYYRNLCSVVEAKVAKLLILSDQGMITKFAGKTLEAGARRDFFWV